jgi:hypothetical protein
MEISTKKLKQLLAKHETQMAKIQKKMTEIRSNRIRKSHPKKRIRK